MGNPPVQSKVAREYRDKYGLEMPIRKLARIMYGDHPTVFKDYEDARQALRYIEGKQGKPRIGKNILASKYLQPPRPIVYNLPKSDEEKFPNYIIKGHKKGLIISDVHLPYHNEAAIVAMLDFAVKEKPDFIFINGDLVDFHMVSFFLKDPRKKSFADEVAMATEFLAELKRVFKCKIYFKFGNHEERYSNFILQKAHEIKGLEEFELETIFKARVPDLQIIPEKRIVIIGGLPFIHGHEFGRTTFSPVNAARGLFLQAIHSCVKGDCHSTSEHVAKDVMDKMITTWSVGCLCGLSPRYSTRNKWNHGFAMIDVLGDKKYKFRNYRILNGEVL